MKGRMPGLQSWYVKKCPLFPDTLMDRSYVYLIRFVMICIIRIYTCDELNNVEHPWIHTDVHAHSFMRSFIYSPICREWLNTIHFIDSWSIFQSHSFYSTPCNTIFAYIKILSICNNLCIWVVSCRSFDKILIQIWCDFICPRSRHRHHQS